MSVLYTCMQGCIFVCLHMCCEVLQVYIHAWNFQTTTNIPPGRRREASSPRIRVHFASGGSLCGSSCGVQLGGQYKVCLGVCVVGRVLVDRKKAYIHIRHTPTYSYTCEPEHPCRRKLIHSYTHTPFHLIQLFTHTVTRLDTVENSTMRSRARR